MEQLWPIRLFRRSVLKQRKFKEIVGFLGETKGLSCLDIGSDNGVISYLLRQRGGDWKSADLDQKAVETMRSLVKTDVFQVDGLHSNFADNSFDRVVIVDFLEHIHTDREFVQELYRLIKPDGELILNVPHTKNSLLRKFRLAIGQTDEKHGHVRPGYSLQDLHALLNGHFSILFSHTYSKFFTECVDTLITGTINWLKKGEGTTKKGHVVSGQDLRKFQFTFRMYTLIYPIVWTFSALDRLLFWQSGYMMIAKARTQKGSTS